MSEHVPTEPVAQGSEDGLSLLDLALVLAENLRFLILVPLLAGLVALGITFLITPTYTATTQILPPQYQSPNATALMNQLGALANIPGFALGGKSIGDQYVALIQSRTVADKIIKRFGLEVSYGKKTMDDTRKELESNTKVTLGPKSGLISIEVDDTDSKQAAAMANAFVIEVRDLTNMLAMTEAAQRRLFFEKQVAKEKDNLVKAEVALRRTGVGEGALKASPGAVVAEVAGLKARVKAQEVKLSVMRTYVTDASPDYRQAQQELVALRAQLDGAEQSEGSTDTRSAADYVSRYRDFKYHEVLFDQLAKQLELARLDEARDSSVIQVVDPAVPPDRKSKPKRALVSGLTATAAFFLMLLYVLIRHAIVRAANDQSSATKLARLQELLQLRRRNSKDARLR